MEYREVFAELAPTSTEKAYLNHYLKETEIGNTKMSPEVVARLEEVKKQQDKFVKDSDFIITGKMSKSDLYEAKARITEKKKDEQPVSRIERASVMPHEAYIIAAVSDSALIIEIPGAHFEKNKAKLTNLPVNVILPQISI